MASPVELDIRHMTFEVGESVRQVRQKFELARNEIDGGDLVFSNIGQLLLWGSLFHFNMRQMQTTRSYHRPTDTYFVSGINIDYQAWIDGDWAARVLLLAEAGKAGVARVAKTRLSSLEVEGAIAAIDRMAAIALTSPPAVLALIAASDWQPVPDVEPTLFKLYKRDGDVWSYYEVWIDDADIVTVHEGRCGESGTAETFAQSDRASGLAYVKAKVAEGRKREFRPVPESRQPTLVVDLLVTEDDPDALLDRRHALEGLLDQELGWLGLGHCDGGDIGAEGASVFCPVVSYALAATAVRNLLDRSGYANATIRRNR